MLSSCRAAAPSTVATRGCLHLECGRPAAAFSKSHGKQSTPGPAHSLLLLLYRPPFEAGVFRLPQPYDTSQLPLVSATVLLTLHRTPRRIPKTLSIEFAIHHARFPPSRTPKMHKPISALFLTAFLTAFTATTEPQPPGKLVNLGNHRLHVNCTGKGAPTVVVENGLGDFSIDWTLVQSGVSAFTRICTYDRAGYAWSDPGPKPRTFAQINLELHDALAKLGEAGPFVLVGHSFGGPVVRNYAMTYPKDVAWGVFVAAAHEGLRVGIGGGKTIGLGDGAKGKIIPAPHEELSPSDRPTIESKDLPAE